MDDLDRYVAERSARDPEFRSAHEADRALLELVRARQMANMTQKDVAEALHVSQPYIAQIERGTRAPGYRFLFRYATAVGASIRVAMPTDRVTTDP
jgi:transcriptional regulator with XRE-family HTH domain